MARLFVYGEVAYRLPPTRTAAVVQRQATFRDRARSSVAIYGTAYLWTAGLMNLLLLFDIWDIFFVRDRKP